VPLLLADWLRAITVLTATLDVSDFLIITCGLAAERVAEYLFAMVRRGGNVKVSPQVGSGAIPRLRD
jgi:hypothetical protein